MSPGLKRDVKLPQEALAFCSLQNLQWKILNNAALAQISENGIDIAEELNVLVFILLPAIAFYNLHQIAENMPHFVTSSTSQSVDGLRRCLESCL